MFGSVLVSSSTEGTREGAPEHFKELPCCGDWESFQVSCLNSSLEK